MSMRNADRAPNPLSRLLNAGWILDIPRGGPQPIPPELLFALDLGFVELLCPRSHTDGLDDRAIAEDIGLSLMAQDGRSRVRAESRVLAACRIGGFGLVRPGRAPPAGFQPIVVAVDSGRIVGLTPLDVQDDIGLPWSTREGDPHWFDSATNDG